MTTVPALSDLDFQKLKAGDHRAFRKVYDQYYGLLRYIALSCGCSETEVPDVLQEVFSSLYLKCGSIADAAGVKSWLCVTTRNYIIDQARKRKNRPSVALEDISESLANDDVAQREESLRQLELNLVSEQIEEFSGRPGHDNFSSFYVKGMKAKDIAEASGEPISTVTNRISRLRKIFLTELSDQIQAIRNNNPFT